MAGRKRNTVVAEAGSGEGVQASSTGTPVGESTGTGKTRKRRSTKARRSPRGGLTAQSTGTATARTNRANSAEFQNALVLYGMGIGALRACGLPKSEFNSIISRYQ